MSRIGKLPIEIPKGVEVTVSDGLVNVKGPKGNLVQKFDTSSVSINIDGSKVTLTRTSDSKEHRAKHGLYRALIANMVKGVSQGFTIEQELVGVGYKASNNGQLLELSLGYSHNIVFELPTEIKVKTVTEKGKNPVIILESADKQLLGQVAAKIRSLRKPEPYKGKGIKFVGEVLRRKAGKAAGK
jgi:large subunit ribosomal protein L6